MQSFQSVLRVVRDAFYFVPSLRSLMKLESFCYVCGNNSAFASVFLLAAFSLLEHRDAVREQADMSLYGFKFLRWLLKNAAWRRGSPAKEDVMAKLIEFYVPANFQSPKKQWTPEELRGKIINFHAGTTRKSA